MQGTVLVVLRLCGASEVLAHGCYGPLWQMYSLYMNMNIDTRGAHVTCQHLQRMRQLLLRGQFCSVVRCAGTEYMQCLR